MNEQYYYNLLGVTKQNSNEEIKKAYHAKAKKYHPDLNIGNVEAKQKFMEISEAYRIIMNIRSKKKDWLKNLIIKAPAAKKSEATKEPKSGEDIYKVITISFLESLSGCKKKLNVERYKICGCVENGIPSSCCPICNGTGKIKTNNTIMFNIPKNIQDGQSIRISGKGNKGEAGGADGDLIIRIQVKADENIIVKGNDLYYKQEITFPEAVLGVRKQIPTLKGIETCTIPPGTSSRQKFCMKNRGLTDENGNTGHQYVIIKIIIPKIETKEQINLLKEVQQKLY